MSEAVAAAISDPILNPPYGPPSRHFVIGSHGPTGEVAEGRRPSESYIPIAQARRGSQAPDTVQDALDFDLTGERRERNGLINDLRRDVDLWRQRAFHGTTPTSKNLLDHWADPDRENRVLFCQREAAETAIFLAEVAGRHGYRDWRRELDEQNAAHNADLPRVALKMATGAGKTVVMAMLIAWQTLNKLASPRDARFCRRFLIVTPGITIRDRLRVLLPEDSHNYYDQRELVPADSRAGLQQAQIVITNYHAFLRRDAKEIRGVAANTRKLLLGDKLVDPFTETADMMVSRVLRDLSGSTTAGRAGELVVFNDEAHHCYVDRPLDSTAPADRPTNEEVEANEEARVWFRGLQAVAKSAGIKTIYDLSATPFYLRGSGYHEGYIFPWTVSDFSLMDAIESGIVKIPRTPVDDDATGDLVTYLRLWDYIGDDLPKRRTARLGDSWPLPPQLEGALQSLYTSYKAAFTQWETNLAPLGEPPPVFIVVCPNTVVSKRVFDWIAGSAATGDAVDGTPAKPGNLGLFSNVRDGSLITRPRTMLIDSAQLESGEPLSKDFKAAATEEIDAFKAEYRRRNPGADVDKLTDEDLLREVMNTVGKSGRLGADIRCVVSVAMLTEGWDANTVTHILGIRAFRSQLLCEQVVGRGLRRRSYVTGDDGRFEPEYANIYGVPFAFIPTDRPMADLTPKSPALHVHAVEGREHLRITFPRVEGYRLEIPDAELDFDPGLTETFEIGPSTVPTWTESAGIIGEAEVVADRGLVGIRDQSIAFELAKYMINSEHFNPGGENVKPWLFPRLVTICSQWLRTCVEVHDGFTTAYLLRYAEYKAVAAEAVYRAITVQVDNRRARIRPILRRFAPVGSTESVSFLTRKATMPATRSEVSHVTLDGPGGNTWEQVLALECELPGSRIAAYVKNDHVGSTIPYVYKGVTHSYVPDFLIRLQQAPGETFDRTLVVEVSGGRKSAHSPGPTKVKAETARDSWCAAVNNHGGFGRWGYVEITSMVDVHERLTDAITNLYADAPIIGDPDLLDYSERLLSREGTRRGA